ncbi:tyrosine-protein phosphatase [Plantibacter sp. Mn2098]|uniref:tyrosine-protein phosphatase n=1 Tax=Plantibacter sp. Mn2098 TaxID=3395266 RepID=UPI003BD0CCB9
MSAAGIGIGIGIGIGLAGTANFRDIGGLPTSDGGSTRSGVLYRSDALHRLDDAGRASLAALGVATVVDLRSDAEALAMPNAIDETLLVVRHDLAAGAVGTSIASLPTLDELYRTILRDAGPALADIANVVADPHVAGAAIVIHCTAGKDRTGVATAVLLDAVGVDRAAIVADYARSADNLAGAWADQMLAGIRASGVEPTPDIVTLVTASPAETMARTLLHLDEHYGGAAAYLRAHGVTEDQLGLLAERLVERPVSV